MSLRESAFMSRREPTAPPRRWFLWTGVAVGLALAVVGAVVLSGCGSRPSPESPEDEDPDEFGIPAVRFTEITTGAGLHFRHVNGGFGKKLLPETMGSG